MRKAMTETQYRASRVCRILGNPTAYQIIRLLEDKKMRPSDIAEDLGISVTLASATLRILRNIDVLRYETKGKEKYYWLKEETIESICNTLEKFVTKIRHKTF
jgi:DNA-binding transcriptional ArsR family regulator